MRLREIHIYQHDLPVKSCHMVQEKGFDHVRLVGLVAALHHRP